MVRREELGGRGEGGGEGDEEQVGTGGRREQESSSREAGERVGERAAEGQER
jgi:hypothetical protein